MTSAPRLPGHTADSPADGGPQAIADPISWLIGRGLPRRSDCSDARCDESIRMESGAACGMCSYRIADRRALRRQIATQLHAELPDIPTQERQAVYEERLRVAVAEQQEVAARHCEQALLEQERRAAAAAQARAEAEAAEEARLAEPCADCGLPQDASLRPVCREERTVTELISSTIDPVVAAWADLTAPDNIQTVTDMVTDHFQATITDARARLRAQAGEHATAHGLALAARLAAETATEEARTTALSLLSRTAEAYAEGQLAAEAVMCARHRYPSRDDAWHAATAAGAEATMRTARHLLDTRIAKLKVLRSTPPPAAEASLDPYAAGAARVRAALAHAQRPWCSELTRSRGEDTIPTVMDLFDVGSPPLARRRPSCCVRWWSQARLTSARAEKTPPKPRADGAWSPERGPASGSRWQSATPRSWLGGVMRRWRSLHRLRRVRRRA